MKTSRASVYPYQPFLQNYHSDSTGKEFPRRAADAKGLRCIYPRCDCSNFYLLVVNWVLPFCILGNQKCIALRYIVDLPESEMSSALIQIFA